MKSHIVSFVTKPSHTKWQFSWGNVWYSKDNIVTVNFWNITKGIVIKDGKMQSSIVSQAQRIYVYICLHI